jgi:hypothetical protein
MENFQMFTENLSLRLGCLRAMPCVTLILLFGSPGMSQQIPCPITTSYINSGTAFNALNPGFINPGARLDNQGAFDNEVSGVLNNFGVLENDSTGGGVTNEGDLPPKK